ncbi:MAG: hypothetical protein O7B99_07175 [Planctomycetota bacterium]|nr:hypothetical protein [Planctomycetota bacterium]
MRSVIKRDNVHVSDEPAHGASRPISGPAEECEPGKTVRLMRAEGYVRAIELTCSCGETTVLELDYQVPQSNVDPNEKAAPAASPVDEDDPPGAMDEVS